MRVRAVLFDAGNTLIRVKSSVGLVYAEVAGRHGLPDDGATLDRAFRDAFSRRKSGFLASVSGPHSPEREKAWWRSLVGEVFLGAGLADVDDACFAAFFEEVYDRFEQPDVWEVFPDVLLCLDELVARGLLLGVVSNWDSRLHAVLAGLGLAERFRFVLTSAEHGAEKPDPSIFREAARRLGVPPAQVLHAGDLLAEDVAGATAAGMLAVLVDRACGAAPLPPPSARVCDLKDLPKLLER